MITETPMIEELKAALEKVKTNNYASVGYRVAKDDEGNIKGNYHGWSVSTLAIERDTLEELVEALNAATPITAKLRQLDEAAATVTRLKAEVAELQKGGVK